MTPEKKSPAFFIICCCLLTVPFFLAGPAAAQDNVLITGNPQLVVYNITVTGIGTNHAIISWKTNGEANSTVEYGPTASYGSLGRDGDMVKDHTIYVDHLVSGRTYHFRVKSCNLAGACAEGTDMTFTTIATSPVPPRPGLNDWGDGGSDDWSIFPKTTQPVTLPQPTLTVILPPVLPEQPPQSPLTGPAPQPPLQNQEQYGQTNPAPAAGVPAMQSGWPVSPLWIAAILILILLALTIIALYLRQSEHKKT
jgi:hypothetical protein